MSQLSQSEPARDGNTKSSLAPPNNQKKHWMLTLKWTHGINEPMFNSLKNWIQINCTRCTFQLEKGESTDYLHLQMAVSLKTKQRFNWFKVHLSPIVHCEIQRNIENSFDYCMKNDSRIWGPYIYPEPPCQPVIDDLDGVELYDWQIEIINKIEGPVDKRKIHWYWEPNGNVGKTIFTRHLLIKYKCAFFQGGKKSDIAYAYNGEPICIFNFPRTSEGHISYDAIEGLKDGLVFSAKYESRYKIFNRPHVIVFANFEPDYSALSSDRWDVNYIL